MTVDPHTPATLADQIRQRLRFEQKFGITSIRRRPERFAAAVAAAPPPAAEAQVQAPPHADEHIADEAPAPVAASSPARSRDEVMAELDRIREQVAVCERCPALVRGRNKTVFSDGSPFTPLMFIGEAPGADEDRQGVPFVGAAGQKLTEIIERGLGVAAKKLLGLDAAPTVPRQSVYIANVLKCRPPMNRDPLPDEVDACRDYLAQQIQLVHPTVIIALGLPAARRLLGLDLPMARMRGKRYPLPEMPDITVVPTYHPSYLLRSYTMDNRKRVMDDITEAMAALHEAGKLPWWD
ncbi:MAG: uracil-DNA glycosylase family protein, partial [Planctomycetota bacterium]